MASGDFILTTEELRLKLRKRRGIVIALLFLVLLLLLGFFGGIERCPLHYWKRSGRQPDAHAESKAGTGGTIISNATGVRRAT